MQSNYQSVLYNRWQEESLQSNTSESLHTSSFFFLPLIWVTTFPHRRETWRWFNCRRWCGVIIFWNTTATGTILNEKTKHTFGAARSWAPLKSAAVMETYPRILLAPRTLSCTIIQVPATAFCSAWVNTNSISVSGNSQVASWQDFWAEWRSIVRGYRYIRVCVWTDLPPPAQACVCKSETCTLSK